MTWPDGNYQIYTGSYGGLDERFKRLKRKQPIGFAPPEPKPKKKRRKTKS